MNQTAILFAVSVICARSRAGRVACRRPAQTQRRPSARVHAPRLLTEKIESGATTAVVLCCCRHTSSIHMLINLRRTQVEQVEQRTVTGAYRQQELVLLA